MRIVLDCAQGAAYKIAPSVFKKIGAEVIVIANRPDGKNINEGESVKYNLSYKNNGELAQEISVVFSSNNPNFSLGEVSIESPSGL